MDACGKIVLSFLLRLREREQIYPCLKCDGLCFCPNDPEVLVQELTTTEEADPPIQPTNPTPTTTEEDAVLTRRPMGQMSNLPLAQRSCSN